MIARKILVAHDFSPNSSPALDESIRLARSTGAEVVLLHVFPAPSTTVSIAPREAQLGILERIVSHVRSFHVAAELLVVEADGTATAILEAAEDEEADLIVVGTHSRSGFDRAILGSVAEEVLRKSRCPVLVVKAGRESPLQPIPDLRVIVGIDFSPSSLEAVHMAAGVARLLDGRLNLLHVCSPAHASHAERDRAEDRLEEIANELRTHSFRVTTAVAVAEDPARALVAEAEGDPRVLIAVGTRGNGRLVQWLLGSVAADVVRRAPCPVLVSPARREISLWHDVSPVDERQA